MCFAMGDQKFDEDVCLEAPHGAVEQQRVMIAIVEMVETLRPVTPSSGSSSPIVPDFEDLSVTTNSPPTSGESFGTTYNQTGSHDHNDFLGQGEETTDSNYNELETVEYYLSQPNAETGEEDLHRIHIEQTPNYVDGNPLYMISSENYSSTARFGPRLNDEDPPQFFIQHEFDSSTFNGFPQPNSQQSIEFSDYVAAASAFMQDRYPHSTLNGSAVTFNSNSSQGLSAGTRNHSETGEEHYSGIEYGRTFRASETGTRVNFSRGSGPGLLGASPTSLHPTGAPGRIENGTTYYGGNPAASQPAQPTHPQFQVHPQMYQSGGRPPVIHTGSGQNMFILPGPPQFQPQPMFSYDSLPPPQPMGVQTSNGIQYTHTRVPTHPYGGRPNPTIRPFPSQSTYQVGPPAHPTYGVGFPQPRPNPNRVQFSTIGGPFNIHLTSVPATVPHLQPVQMQIQDFPPPQPYIILPQPPSPIYSGGLPGQQMNRPGSNMMLPPRYEQVNPHGQQHQVAEFFTGPPLMYYPGAESNNLNFLNQDSVNYNNTDVYAYADSKNQQEISGVGFQRYMDDINMRGLAKYMVRDTLQVNESIGTRTSTAESESSTSTRGSSWSELMDDEDIDDEDSNSTTEFNDSPRSSSTSDSLQQELCKKEERAGEKAREREVTDYSDCGETVSQIIRNMVDCGSTFYYRGKEFPYVANCWDERIVATAKLPQRLYNYYVPPSVQDDDFFGGQQYLWQLKMMSGFGRFHPDIWRIQALPDFEKRSSEWYNFTVTSKLRFCCRTCSRAWTSMRGKILFSIIYDIIKKKGNILMKIFGQVCTRNDCDDLDFQTPTCYPEEILRVVWKLSEFVGCIYYNIPLSVQFHYDPDKAIRCGNPATPHRKEFCQACQKGVCSRV